MGITLELRKVWTRNDDGSPLSLPICDVAATDEVRRLLARLQKYKVDPEELGAVLFEMKARKVPRGASGQEPQIRWIAVRAWNIEGASQLRNAMGTIMLSGERKPEWLALKHALDDAITPRS